MNEGITFLNSALLWPVVVGVLLLGVVFTLKEWPTRSASGFIRRLLLGLLALIGLAQIVLEPAYWKATKKETVILTTPGTSDAQLDSVRRLNRRAQNLEYSPGTDLSRELAGKAVFLLGHGLASYDLWQTAGAEVTFLEAPTPEGVVQLQHTQTGVLGYPISVRGSYARPAQGTSLFLLDPGGNPVDSLKLDEELEAGSIDGEVPFRLEGQPQVAGNLLYYLEERDSSGARLRTNPIPIRIAGPSPRKILILNTFPTFETRRLKEFLTASGASVLIRSQLTRGAYKFEYINREAKPVYRLNAQSLEGFQLVICDTGSLLNLSASSRAALQDAIQNRGLALLVQPDAGYFSRKNTFGHLTFVRDNQESFTHTAQDEVVQKYPYRPALQFPEERITTREGELLGVYRPYGLGRILGSVLRDTYQLPLQGNQASYNALWTALLNAALPPAEQGLQWKAQTELPRKDAPFRFQVRTTSDSTRVLDDTGQVIPLMQDFHLPYLWEGTDYPLAPGWNRLSAAESGEANTEGDPESFDFYTFGEDDWQAREASARLAANRREFNGQLANQEPVMEVAAISPLWGFMLFLLCMGWLWLEPRLLG